jgi:hypothetical protein
MVCIDKFRYEILGTKRTSVKVYRHIPAPFRALCLHIIYLLARAKIS